MPEEKTGLEKLADISLEIVKNKARIKSIEELLVNKGVLTEVEIEEKYQERYPEVARALVEETIGRPKPE